MTKEQFNKVKYGDKLVYNDAHCRNVLVQVTGKYKFAGGERITADVVSEGFDFRDCDAPISYFEVTKERNEAIIRNKKVKSTSSALDKQARDNGSENAIQNA